MKKLIHDLGLQLPILKRVCMTGVTKTDTDTTSEWNKGLNLFFFSKISWGFVFKFPHFLAALKQLGNKTKRMTWRTFFWLSSRLSALALSCRPHGTWPAQSGTDTSWQQCHGTFSGWSRSRDGALWGGRI